MTFETFSDIFLYQVSDMVSRIAPNSKTPKEDKWRLTEVQTIVEATKFPVALVVEGWTSLHPCYCMAVG